MTPDRLRAEVVSACRTDPVGRMFFWQVPRIAANHVEVGGVPLVIDLMAIRADLGVKQAHKKGGSCITRLI